MAWLDGRASRASDLGLGLLSRPAPWLSLGATAAHVTQSRFEGAVLSRDYTLGQIEGSLLSFTATATPVIATEMTSHGPERPGSRPTIAAAPAIE